MISFLVSKQRFVYSNDTVGIKRVLKNEARSFMPPDLPTTNQKHNGSLPGGRQNKESTKRKKGEGEYTMTVATVAEFRIQFMAADKANAEQLDFGGSKPLWSVAFCLVEKARKRESKVESS
jgi:hypothetical protein